MSGVGRLCGHRWALWGLEVIGPGGAIPVAKTSRICWVRLPTRRYEGGGGGSGCGSGYGVHWFDGGCGLGSLCRRFARRRFARWRFARWRFARWCEFGYWCTLRLHGNVHSGNVRSGNVRSGDGRHRVPVFSPSASVPIAQLSGRGSGRGVGEPCSRLVSHSLDGGTRRHSRRCRSDRHGSGRSVRVLAPPHSIPISQVTGLCRRGIWEPSCIDGLCHSQFPLRSPCHLWLPGHPSGTLAALTRAATPWLGPALLIGFATGRLLA